MSIFSRMDKALATIAAPISTKALAAQLLEPGEDLGRVTKFVSAAAPLCWQARQDGPAFLSQGREVRTYLWYPAKRVNDTSGTKRCPGCKTVWMDFELRHGLCPECNSELGVS